MLPGKRSGFTLIEIVIVLAIIAILASILTPTLTKYVADAKIRKAESDVQVIATAMGAFNRDVNEWPLYSDGSTTKVKVLQGPGDMPTGGTGATGWVTTTAADVDDILDQLVTNGAGYPTTGRGRGKWLGPYLTELTEDPWGNKYLVNVEFLWPANVGNDKSVFVLSAGPDETVDTDYDSSKEEPEGDDIVFRIK